MKEYSVRVPMCGYVEFTVNANSEEEAKCIGLNSCTDLNVSIDDQYVNQGLAALADESLDFLEKTGEGNVTYLECNEIEAEEL